MNLYLEYTKAQPYMTNFRIYRNHFDYSQPRTQSYIVKADSDRFGKDTTVFESYKLQECADWILDTCEFYLDIFEPTDIRYKQAQDTIKKYSKKPTPIEVDYDEQAFEQADFNKVTKVITKAVKQVESILYIDLPVSMFKLKPDKDLYKAARGSYTRAGISVNLGILDDERRAIQTVVHEIGHYIHDRYFADQRFKWSKEDRTSYSFTNNYEAFAETFVQFIKNPDSTSPNVRKMRELFENMNLLRI